MFRNYLPPVEEPSPVQGRERMLDPRPVITPAVPITPRSVSQGGRRAVLKAASMRERLKAGAMHLALSATVGLAVVVLVLFAWYPAPMANLHGVGTILAIMLAVDVVLGPLFTLILFDRRKKNLALDLAAVAAVQLLALAYGLHTVQQGRPTFVVLVKDRFEVVSPAEILPSARKAAQGNPLAVPDPTGPRWVAARLPDSAAERNAMLLEALEKGHDIQHHPRLYVAYESQARQALERALPLSKLRELNPAMQAQIDAAIGRSGLREADLAYLPLRGPVRDAAVLVSRIDTRVVQVMALRPW